MKKYIILLMFTLLYSAINFAQITPPFNPDNFIQSGSPANTTLAIAPDVPGGAFDITASAFELGVNSSIISIADNSLPTVYQTISNVGVDPDIAFGPNYEMFSIVTYDNVSDAIIYSEYYMTSTISKTYSLGFQQVVDQVDVSYPNLDWNGDFDGVITYEKSGDIMVCHFSLSYIGNPTVVARGNQSDVAVQEKINEYALSFINPAGDLEIHSHCDLQALSSFSSYVLGNQQMFPPLVSFERPRIAVPHNMHAGLTHTEFTVVVADNNDEIWGFFENGGIMPYVQVNFNTYSSYELEPVVAYQNNKVKVAWSSDHGMYAWGTGVLSEEFDFNGICLSPASHQQVSWGSINFQTSTSGLACQYDGQFPVPPSHENESIIYHDGTSVFWKNENTAWGNIYKTTNETPSLFTSINETTTFRIDTESKSVNIDIANETKNIIIAYNSSGQKFAQIFTAGDGIYVLDYSSFPKGIYFITCSNHMKIETIKIHNF